MPLPDDVGRCLTNDDLDQLLRRLIDTYGGKPPEGDTITAVRWAEDARMQNAVLDMVLAGDASVRVVGGEVRFRLTPKGHATAESMLANDPEAAAFTAKLLASLRGDNYVAAPKREQ